MIDIGNVLDLIDIIVDEEGEDHTARSVYVNGVTGQPECGVGRVLHLLGVDIEILRGLGPVRLNSITDEELGLEFTLGARQALEAFQEAQDGTYSLKAGHMPREWGEARREAYRVAENILDFAPDRIFKKELATV